MSSAAKDQLDFVKRSLKYASTTWVIDDFRRRREAQGIPIISPVFSISDENSNTEISATSFRMYFYPNGIEDLQQTALFLFGDKSEFDCVKARFAVSILDKHGEVKAKKVCLSLVRGVNNKAGWSKFYPRRKILDALSQILRNGTLSFVIEVYYIEEDISGAQLNSIFNLTTLFEPKTKSGSEEFKDLYEQKQYDIVLRVKDRSIPAHRVVLETSHVIEKYLIRDRRTYFILDDFDYHVVMDVVYFMYHQSFESEHPDFKTMLKFADKYKVPALKFFCEQQLYDTVSIDNVLEVYRLAHDCNSTLLMNALRFVIRDNIIGITETKGWFDFLLRDQSLITNIVRFLASANGKEDTKACV